MSPAELLDRTTASSLMHKVGHEIGNPLTSIISLAAILARFSSAPVPGVESKLPQYANSIAAEAWKISRISDMLVMLFSELPGNASLTEVGPAVNRALGKLKTRTNLDTDPVVVQIQAAGSPGAYIDSEQFSILIAELVANALQGAAQGNSDAEAGNVTVRVSAAPFATFVTVSNRAAAVNPNPLEELFKPLVTTFQSQRHLGLGLAMASAIVYRAKGSLELEEQVLADGTVQFTARVSLPNSSSAPDAKSLDPSGTHPAIDSAAEVRTGPRQILIVEDQAMVSSAIKKILEFTFKGESKVECSCVNGSEALALFAEGRLFDAVLCDINLTPLQGGDVFSEACKRNPAYRNRFAFMTGGPIGGAGSKPGTADRMFNRPCLAKPFEPDQLIGVIKQLLAQ